MLELHTYWRSSASYRVRIALALKGLEAEHHPVNLKAGEQRGDAYRALNPQGLLPMLSDGDLRIGQKRKGLFDQIENLQHARRRWRPSTSPCTSAPISR